MVWLLLNSGWIDYCYIADTTNRCKVCKFNHIDDSIYIHTVKPEKHKLYHMTYNCNINNQILSE